MGRSQTPERPVTVRFGNGVLAIFEELPENVRREARQSMELLAFNPYMYEVRRRGVMRGHRYFLAGRYYFYYSVSSTEVRIDAIVPAAMRRA